MKFEAVLFDLDGTLLDTIEDLTDSMNEALKCLGFPVHDSEACKMFVGDGVEKFALRALPKNRRDEVTVARCVTGMREVYSKRWAQKTRPYDGIPELLDNLTRREIKLAVLSNKPHDSTQEMVTKLLSKWRFDPVVGARPSVPRKPDPTLALHIAQQLQVAPENFLYLGDTGTDMRTARGAGMFPVGALWGYRTAKELKSTGADVLVAHPSEVLQLL
ncbi:MAG: HAD family hydrolase [Syntrophobacteria bacterium]